MSGFVRDVEEVQFEPVPTDRLTLSFFSRASPAPRAGPHLRCLRSAARRGNRTSPSRSGFKGTTEGAGRVGSGRTSALGPTFPRRQTVGALGARPRNRPTEKIPCTLLGGPTVLRVYEGPGPEGLRVDLDPSVCSRSPNTWGSAGRRGIGGGGSGVWDRRYFSLPPVGPTFLLP